MKKKLFILSLFLLPVLGFGQSPPKQVIDLENFIERLFPIQEEDIDYESIYEVLLQLYLNPIDINRADAEVLQASYLLNPAQVSSLITYRNSFGSFLSLYELQAVPEFDLQTIENLIPFITLGESGMKSNKFWDRVREEEQAYLLFRHQQPGRLEEGLRHRIPAETAPFPAAI
ncbi:helix-hairpin-helix domain-containing protein [Algoriphagus boritolerans]|uniref:ComEA family DNA-binding protein n=1 Tax=Algoriphagus boritolerans TaxID=308111 RepID=UPI000AD6DBE3